MPSLSLDELRTQLQNYVNYVEVWERLKRQGEDPYVKEALDLLIDAGHEALSALSGFLRRRGVAPGVYELNRHGRAKTRKLLVAPPDDQLVAVRHHLTDLTAWSAAHPPDEQSDTAMRDLLDLLSEQARCMLQAWDQHLDEMKLAQSKRKRRD
jgi:hypothetical protein